MDRLASFSRLILLDRRGTGLSDGMAPATTLDDAIDDIRAVMDDDGMEQAVLIGWRARWRQGGLEALRSAGPTPRLSETQPHAIDQALRQGARAHGFDTDHWTLARITTVIERLTGVGYHPGHTWKLLRHRLGYCLQRPARRAIERDEAAIARWVAEDWPEDPGRRPSAAGCLGVWDESGPRCCR